jgi:hypothetical protein
MKITLGEIVMKKLNPEDYFLPTAFGCYKISGITKDWWVITGKDFSRRSFCCVPRTEVYSTIKETEKRIEDDKNELDELKRKYGKSRIVI